MKKAIPLFLQGLPTPFVDMIIVSLKNALNNVYIDTVFVNFDTYCVA